MGILFHNPLHKFPPPLDFYMLLNHWGSDETLITFHSRPSGEFHASLVVLPAGSLPHRSWQQSHQTNLEVRVAAIPPIVGVAGRSHDAIDAFHDYFQLQRHGHTGW